VLCDLGRLTRGFLLAVAVVAIAGGTAAGQAASPSLIVFSADRAPSLSGEIYRVDPDGHLVDLSNSPFQDFDPVATPDGKRVAFISNRSGDGSVYEVGIDGSGLVRVGQIQLLHSPNDPTGEGAELAWQPHGGRLAAGGTNGVWIVQPGQTAVDVRAASGVDGWSPDGRVLVATEYIRGTGSYRALALSPAGRVLWRIRNLVPWGATWSARGLLAVVTGGNAARARQAVHVYDESGHLRFSVAFGHESPWATWSPDGSRVALASKRALQIRTATGRVLLQRKFPHDYWWNHVGWDGDGRVVLAGYGSCRCHVRSVDILTGKTSRASHRWAAQTSADGRLAVLRTPSGDGFDIQVARTAGGRPRTYLHTPRCGGGQFGFVPASRSLLYTSNCWEPPHGLYSVPAGGGAAHQITKPGSDNWQPALSPDGGDVAYSLASSAPSDIRVLNVDGSGERTLTEPPACTGLPKVSPNGDFEPSWSPDGTTILFSRQSCGNHGLGELYTVSANGGAVHDLGLAGSNPVWGPSRIAYDVGAGSTAAALGVWTANPDGTDPVRVDSSGYSPAWSPDGQLAYLKATKHPTLVVGSTQTTLPFAYVASVAWAANGTRLVVTALEAGTAAFDVYTINPDGTDPVRLTEDYGASGASW
jgi:Tol biopolymer transport system component